MSEATRDDLLDDLVKTTRARDLIEDIASRSLEARDVLADALRKIRDETDGPGASIAAHALIEAEIPEPEDG